MPSPEGMKHPRDSECHVSNATAFCSTGVDICTNINQSHLIQLIFNAWERHMMQGSIRYKMVAILSQQMLYTYVYVSNN